MLKELFKKIKNFLLIFNEINNINKKKPKFIFYSENKSYLKYGYLIIEYLSKKYPGEVYYVSSDINDKILNLNVVNVYIGQSFLLLYFFRSIVADNLFMTLTDLNNNIVKKNRFVKNYIYLFHAAVSTTRIYTSTAFDNYDTILCNGDYQIEEIRQREKTLNLKEKKLIKSGFIYFDYLKNKTDKINDKNEILVAPSWNKNRLNFINEDFEEILNNLLNAGYHVRFRPHPETVKRAENLINSYKKKFNYKNFIFDDDPENFKAMQNAKCLITDNSGISIEYMMIFKKPVIFYNDFDKVHNENFEMYKNFTLIEDIIKNRFGYQFNKHQIIEIKNVINEAINKFDKNEIDNFIKDNFYNFEKTMEYFDKNLLKICV
jgi:YidC/Oxa1 family membrane protein insertase